MDDQILIGIQRRLRWLEQNAAHYRIAEDGTAMLTWRGGRTSLNGGGGGDVYLANANVFTQDNTFSSAGPDTLKLTASDAGITFGGDSKIYRANPGSFVCEGAFTAERVSSTTGYIGAEWDANGVGGWIDARNTSSGMITAYLADGQLGSQYGFNTSAWSGTFSPWRLRGDGYMEWGSGTAGTDVGLYRDAANILRVASGDSLKVGNFLWLDTDGTGGPLYFGAAADAHISRTASGTLSVQHSLKTAASLTVDTADGAYKLFFGSAADTNLYRSSANLLQTDDSFRAMQTVSAGTSFASGYGAFLTAVSGDSAERLIIANNGTIYWGNGAGTNDTNLYRGGANILSTDDTFQANVLVSNTSATVDLTGAGHRLYFGSAADTSLYRNAADSLLTPGQFNAGRGLISGFGYSAGSINALYVLAAAEANARFELTNAGVMNWGSGSAALDTSLYRDAANILRTGADDSFKVGKFLWLDTGGAAERLYFGASADVSLRRSAALELRTESKLVADLGLDAGSDKITNVADGSVATDAATYGQLTSFGAGYALLAGANTFTALQTIQRASGSALRIAVTGDSAPRLDMNTSGSLTWGDGTTQDTNLYRSGANVLKTDDNFWAAGYIAASGSVYVDNAGGGGRLYFGAAADASIYRSSGDQLSTDEAFTSGLGFVSGYGGAAGTVNGLWIYASGDSNSRFNVTNAGYLQWGSGSSAQDVNLYRQGVGELRSDDQFECENLWSYGSGSNGRVYLGATADAYLYRSAATTVATNSHLAVGGNLAVGGPIDFPETAPADKLLLYSDGYGIGIESGTLTNWSGATFRWRIGGTSVSSGTEYMTLTSGGLAVNAVTISGQAAVTTNDTRIPTQSENDALTGSYGAPNSANTYVTLDDPVWTGLSAQPGIDLEYDTVSNATAGTGTLSWTHTPVTAAPKGILVGIVQNSGITDEVTAVTYGGLPMVEVKAAQVIQSAGAEDGMIYWYFLGSFIPTGAQTVTVTVSGASTKAACAISVKGTEWTSLVRVDTLSSAGVANPSASVAAPLGVEGFVVAALHSGHDAVSSVTAGSGYTEIYEHDFTSQVASVIRKNTNAQSETATPNWTATTEEAGVSAIAIKAGVVRDFGIIHQGTALTSYPTSQASIGDTCTYEADATNGVYWRLVFTGGSNWRFIGGPPLLSSDDDTQTITATSSSAVPGDPISITLPITGTYRARIGCQHLMTPSATGQNGIHTMSINGSAGTSANGTVWQPDTASVTSLLGLNSRWIELIGRTGGDTVSEHAFKSAAGATYQVRRRAIEVVPVTLT